MFAIPVGHDDMPTFNPRLIGQEPAQLQRIDGFGGAESFWRGVKNDGNGGQLRPPDHRVIKLTRRIGEKTTPSAARMRLQRFGAQ